MKRVRCPKCDNFITFDETKYRAGQSLVFVCPQCNKQFGIRMVCVKLRETQKEEKLDRKSQRAWFWLYRCDRECLRLQAGHSPADGRQHHRTIHEEQRHQLPHRDRRPQCRHEPLCHQCESRQERQLEICIARRSQLYRNLCRQCDLGRQRAPRHRRQHTLYHWSHFHHFTLRR